MSTNIKAALSASLLALTAMSASAGGSLVASSTCSATMASAVSGAGISVTDCSGFYAGNLGGNADFAAVKSLLQTEFVGVLLGNSAYTINVSNASVNFGVDRPLSGDTVIGVHWGGPGGGNEAFYRLSVGSGFTGSFNLSLANPALGDSAARLSNMTLYSTGGEGGGGVGSPVPEPETYALMLAGLAVVGFVARRRALR